MMGPRVTRMSDGSVRLSELAPWFVGVMLELPDLLNSDQPEDVSRRLYPEPSDDEEQKKDWEKFVRPELFALVATAREIVIKDIGGMGPDEDASGMALWELLIPEQHVHGWISALNVARLTLSEKFKIAEGDMIEPDDEELDPEAVEWSEKRFAVARIHLLGYLQGMLIEEQSPPPEGFDGPR
ncbi:MAG: DUF2017 family protein [Planctomycetota bacterium]|jgi:hypothetical protein